MLTHAVNDAFVAVNRLTGGNEEVYWLREPVEANGKTYPVGTMYIRAKAGTADKVAALADEIGLTFEATASEPESDALMLRSLRVGLWDRYGGSMPSGWTRFMLENFEFPHEVVYAPALDEGNLEERFDVLIFVDGGIPAQDPSGSPRVPELLPEEYEDALGAVTISETVPRIKEFLEAGGTVLAIGDSTILAQHLGLPISDALVEKLPDGGERPLPREKFYVPGSVLRAQVDSSNPLAFGLPSEVDMIFQRSQAFRLGPGAAKQGVEAVAWFGPNSLRSGWAWGEGYLEDTIAVIDANVGRGKKLPDGGERPLPREKFYVPGSVLRAQVDSSNPLAFGLPSEVDMIFQRSQAFRLGPGAAKQGVEAVAWFGPNSLRSGWAWGEGYLEDTIAVIDANVGRGKLFLFGPEIAFRAQPHGTFKFLFNGIYYGRAEPVTLGGGRQNQ